MTIDKAKLRRDIREQRRNIALPQQHMHSDAAFEILSTQSFFQNSQHIAFFLANDGELDPVHAIISAWEAQKNCYLPVVPKDGSNSLYFAPHQPDRPLTPNRMGILEPEHNPQERMPAEQLDLVITPLIAFDELGNRMGMGKGYYDYTFEFLLTQRAQHKTMLIGYAHELQRIDTLHPETWDVPLDGVITERQFYDFRK